MVSSLGGFGFNSFPILDWILRLELDRLNSCLGLDDAMRVCFWDGKGRGGIEGRLLWERRGAGEGPGCRDVAWEEGKADQFKDKDPIEVEMVEGREELEGMGSLVENEDEEMAGVPVVGEDEEDLVVPGMEEELNGPRGENVARDGELMELLERNFEDVEEDPVWKVEDRIMEIVLGGVDMGECFGRAEKTGEDLSWLEECVKDGFLVVRFE